MRNHYGAGAGSSPARRSTNCALVEKSQRGGSTGQGAAHRALQQSGNIPLIGKQKNPKASSGLRVLRGLDTFRTFEP
jgi:hypothetical protein